MSNIDNALQVPAGWQRMRFVAPNLIRRLVAAAVGCSWCQGFTKWHGRLYQFADMKLRGPDVVLSIHDGFFCSKECHDQRHWNWAGNKP